MIEWWIAFWIVSADIPEMGTRHVAKTTEIICRQTARNIPYGKDFVANVDGKDTAAKFEFCMWSLDGVIQDYVKP